MSKITKIGGLIFTVLSLGSAYAYCSKKSSPEIDLLNKTASELYNWKGNPSEVLIKTKQNLESINNATINELADLIKKTEVLEEKLKDEPYKVYSPELQKFGTDVRTVAYHYGKNFVDPVFALIYAMGAVVFFTNKKGIFEN
ncbi:hypothetical protein HY837_05975 [archaeon]|nr:hypothetical protein [archaeon]